MKNEKPAGAVVGSLAGASAQIMELEALWLTAIVSVVGEKLNCDAVRQVFYEDPRSRQMQVWFIPRNTGTTVPVANVFITLKDYEARLEFHSRMHQQHLSSDIRYVEGLDKWLGDVVRIIDRNRLAYQPNAA